MRINIREEIKKIPFIFRLGTAYRCWEQSRRIENEQMYYERIAKKEGKLESDSIDEIKRKLKERLSKRNIIIQNKRNMHIVYASRSVTWDIQNIVPALKKYADVTMYFFKEYGFSDEEKSWINTRDKMNNHFIGFVKSLHSSKPVDLVLTYFSGYRIDCKIIDQINNLGIVTASFNYDDRLSFRGEKIGNRWAGTIDVCKHYDLNLTHAPESLVKYRVENGIVMLWPLAANQDFYYPRKVSFEYDVSFIGTSHGFRKPFIQYLRDKGIGVAVFGRGWENGFIQYEKVPEIFSASKINLNFGDIAYTRYQCGKARDFEIPMSGGLMLTTHNEHLADYFDLDKEIFTFKNKEDCLRQIKRLLSDEKLCKEARIKARERALKEHKWEDRIRELLKVIGYI